jgi:hypothetical protein
MEKKKGALYPNTFLSFSSAQFIHGELLPSSAHFRFN